MTTKQLPETDFAGNLSTLMSALPEPYGLLREGEDIFPGCLMGNPDTGLWELVGAQYWETRVDSAYFQFAAPICPAGFKVVHGDIAIADDSLIWRKREQYWCPVPEIWRKMSIFNFWHTIPSDNNIRYKKNPHLMYFLASDPFICNPIESSWRTRVLPDCHRELNMGDTIRRGDRRISHDIPEWVLCAPSVFGTAVTPELMSVARFARPIPAKWHHWYVDLRRGRGSDTHGDGTRHATACATVNGLLLKITEKQRLTGIPMYGTIWDVRGVPSHVIDVPLDAPLNGIPDTPRSSVVGTPHTIQWLMQHLDLVGAPASQTALLTLAHEALPDQYRELTAAEVCQEHDLMFTLAPGDRMPMMWQPAPARMWHQPGSRHFIFCRHEEAPTMLESPEIRLLNQGERLLKVEKLLTHIVARLDNTDSILADMKK